VAEEKFARPMFVGGGVRASGSPAPHSSSGGWCTMSPKCHTERRKRHQRLAFHRDPRRRFDEGRMIDRAHPE
jgi:hypothetical protein